MHACVSKIMHLNILRYLSLFLDIYSKYCHAHTCRIMPTVLCYPSTVERRQFVESCPGVREEEVWEELCVLALADLQERQMEIYNSTLDFVFSKVH